MEDAQGQVLRKSLMWARPILKKPEGDSIGALVATGIRTVTLDFHCLDGPYYPSDVVMIPSSPTQTASYGVPILFPRDLYSTVV